MEDTAPPKAQLMEVTSSEAGQRIDNFLIKILKGVPRTRIYKAVRSGEVRVNRSRIRVSHKLKVGDQVRIPPIRYSRRGQQPVVPPNLLESVPVLFEDPYLLVVDKPAGLAVHGGTGVQYGLIEAFRQLRPQYGFLELVHRLDRETSGCLMLAKTRPVLLALQQQLGEHRSIGKSYLALVFGSLQDRTRTINLALAIKTEAGKHKRTIADPKGQHSVSKINPLQHFFDTTLIEIELKTGRMHQARAHCAFSGFPIAGDRLYGDEVFNTKMKKLGLGRTFLHAHKLKFDHPVARKPIALEAPLPQSLQAVLDQLENAYHDQAR
jgi:23S rRNA pseudouridine955/2504/2580 synthase